MSTMQRLTLIGLYNYDNTLFDAVTLPEGYDKPTFINALLLEHGEKCVLYPDFDFMKFSLGVISQKWEYELQRIYEALTAEYNPIENYDRMQYDFDTRNVTADYSNNRKPNTSQSEEVITPEITTHEVSAFNSSNYEPSDKTTVTQGKRTTSTSGSDDVTIKGTLSDESYTHDSHIHGNIGVTTAATMVNEITQQRMTKNLYSLATRIFANELLIQIY